jgi:hypothetical protein
LKKDKPIAMKKTILNLTIATGLLLLGSPKSVTAQTPPSYSIYSLGANTTGLSVSQDGNYVTGLYYNTNAGFSNPQPGFLWTQSGGAVTLPAAGPTNYVDTSPNAVNNSGMVAAVLSTTFYGADALPVLYGNTTSATMLPLPEGSSIGKPYGINNAGTVAGTIQSNGSWYAATFTPTSAKVLTQTPTNGAILQYAYGIANSGRVAGQASYTGGLIGYYLDPGASNAVELGSLPGGDGNTVAFGISASGSYITGSSGANPFIYQPETATMTAIDLFAGWTSGEGRSVNDLGWVVGSGGNNTSIPFLFNGVSTYGLQDLLEGPSATGWDMVSGTGNAALGISDNGVITGRALFEGVTTGFVMIPNSPIPEPSTYTLLGLGALGMLIALRRRKLG